MVSPALICPVSTTAFHAVSAAQGSVAASSKLKLPGILIAPVSWSSAYSASTPSTMPPSELRDASAGIRPPVQFTKKVLVTRSPGLNCITPSPAATTSPAPSDNGISGNLV
jgi:hypothetical protein